MQLSRHNQEIKKTLTKIQNCVESNSWRAVDDLTKYLVKLLKERKIYIKYIKEKGEISNEK